MSRPQPHKTSEGAKIRRAAASESFEVLSICDAKLHKNEIWRPDMRHALKTCSVVKFERDGYRTIKGNDREGGEIFLVVTIDAEQRLIVVHDGWR